MILNPILMPDVPALGFECEKKEVAPATGMKRRHRARNSALDAHATLFDGDNAVRSLGLWLGTRRTPFG